MTEYTRAIVTIVGTSPYSQSKQHHSPALQGELPDAHDLRTWPLKMTVVQNAKGERSMAIPNFGLKLALQEAARFSKKKITGAGNSTWTARFERGIVILDHGWLGVDPDTVNCITLSVNADGKRGGGSRVTRRFPQIPAPWTTTFEVAVLDSLITQEIFQDIVEIAGLFIGVGQYRPEKGGSNGRFLLKDLIWEDKRELLPEKIKKAA
jgi:hypothetical protein